MEEERLFIEEKIASPTRVVFVVLANYPDILRLAEKMACDGVLPKREPFGFGNALGIFLKYLYSVILCTTYNLRKYTDYMAVKQFLLKINFVNER